MALENLNNNLAPINWVGMKEMEVPVLIPVDGEPVRTPARAEAKVSLDKKSSRGIHMSRLYVLVQEKLTQNALSFSVLEELTREFLKSHHELSSHAFVSLRFEQPLQRRALKSDNHAWRTYPVIFSSENRQGRVKNFLEAVITYSSTCPASAALSRQLIQENFQKTFAATGELSFEKIHQWLGSTEGIVATPHAQRSFARVKVQVQGEMPAALLIDAVEEALQTAVQGAVKREDEQEFALRNGQNLMFCEDAARRVKRALDPLESVLDYVAELNHVESLHPHNAVSLISKGLDLQGF